MATGEVSTGNSFDSSATGVPPDDKLGYSRHYAQRIRDLGKTSKESWIKRLWNHVFGPSTVTTSSEERWSDNSSPSSNKTNPPLARRPITTNDECSDTQPEVLFVPSGNVVKDKEVRFFETDDSRLSQDFGDTDCKSSSASDGGGSDGSKRRASASTHDSSSKDLPVRLVNSPYLPPKDKVVYYRPVVSSKPREDNRDGVAAAKLRYQKLSSSKSSAVYLSSSSVPNIRISADSVVHGGRRTNQQQQPRNGHEGTAVNDPPRSKVTRDQATIQLEKRAKTAADRAIRVGKVVANPFCFFFNDYAYRSRC
jgi:hypothetical protein